MLEMNDFTDLCWFFENQFSYFYSYVATCLSLHGFFCVCVFSLRFYWSIIAFLIAQLAKNLPPMQETLVRFLGWDDPLEKG